MIAGEGRVIAIDGPGGAGKSTVAKLVAVETGLEYLDTGAMYRSITFAVLERKLDPSDWPAVTAILDDIALDLGPTTVIVDGTDATQAIRGPEVTNNVSAVSANPAVRTAMVRLQREWITQRDGGVIEGRDIGTVVAPQAAVKIFLTASARERAKRRAAETGGDIDAIEAELVRRDEADANRADSPLRPADDSVHVDTTGRTIEQVVAEIAAIAAQNLSS